MTLITVLFFAVLAMAQTPKVVVIPLGKKIDHCDRNQYGGTIPDACGVCGGTAFTCAGCDGVPNSGVTLGCNGSCGSDNTTCSMVSYRGNTQSFVGWARPHTLGNGTSGSCTVMLQTLFWHKPQGFTVDTTGLYTITANWDTWDGFLVIYQTSFDPIDQCTNLIALDDDFNDIYHSQILNITLTAGVQYYIISTSFTYYAYGFFNNSIAGPLGSTITLI